MSRTKHLLLASLMCASAHAAHAVTIDELSEKSRQLRKTEMERDIAKAERDLQQAGGAGAGFSAPSPSRTAEPDKPVEDFSVIALHGNQVNPTVDVLFRGVKYERKRGELAVLDWYVDTIGRDEIKFCKKGGKPCTTRYLSAAPVELPAIRENRIGAAPAAPTFAPPAGAPSSFTQGK